MSGLLISVRPPLIGTVEVSRSFSYKLNAEKYGGIKFESRDFFCSQKGECLPQDAEEVSTRLYEFCKQQVLRDVREYIKSAREQSIGPKIVEKKGA